MTSRIADSNPSPERSGSLSARWSNNGVWFHINLPPQIPLGVRPTVRM